MYQYIESFIDFCCEELCKMSEKIVYDSKYFWKFAPPHLLTCVMQKQNR